MCFAKFLVLHTWYSKCNLWIYGFINLYASAFISLVVGTAGDSMQSFKNASCHNKEKIVSSLSFFCLSNLSAGQVCPDSFTTCGKRVLFLSGSSCLSHLLEVFKSGKVHSLADGLIPDLGRSCKGLVMAVQIKNSSRFLFFWKIRTTETFFILM